MKQDEENRRSFFPVNRDCSIAGAGILLTHAERFGWAP
jgi:hypothetical protein